MYHTSKKICLLAVIYLSLCSTSLAQDCPSSLGTINYQSDLDDFAQNYPNCTSLPNLVINGPTFGVISNLLPMANLDTIWGDVTLNKVSDLANLQGLENLRYIGGNLSITGNTKLIVTEGLDKLDYIGGNLIIEDNDKMVTINGFDQLTTVNGEFQIRLNEKLNAVSLFPQLQNIAGNLTIESNDEITITNAFDELLTIGGQLTLNELQDTEFEFGSLTSIGGGLTLSTTPNLLNLNTFENLISFSGDLELYDFEFSEMTGFNSLTNLNGNLVLWSQNLTTLGGFNNLQNIQGSFELYAPITQFSGFESLSSIGGNLQIQETVICPDLINLNTVGGDLNLLFTGASTLNHFNNLTSIVGKLLIDDGQNVLDSLLGFDNLMTVDEFKAESFPNIAYFGGFGSLIKLNNELYINDFDQLETLDAFAGLTEIDGVFRIENNANLTSISSFNSLTKVNNFFKISGNSSLTLISGFDQLEIIEGELSIVSNSALHTISSFNALESIGGTLNITNNDAMDLLSGFNALNQATFPFSFGLIRVIDGFNGLDTLNSNLNLGNYVTDTIAGFQNLKYVDGNVNITGEALKHIPSFNNLVRIESDLKIENCESLDAIDGFNQLEWVGNFRISSNDLLTSINGFGNLERTSNFFILTNPLLGEVANFPTCTQVGNLLIQDNDTLTTLDLLPNLEKVFNDVDINDNDDLTQIMGFDVLNELQNLTIDFNDQLLTIPSFDALESAVKVNIKFNPQLTTINGFNAIDQFSLDITVNEQLKSILGFANLTMPNDFLIAENDSLETLFPLDNVEMVNGLFAILGNDDLPSISGMQNCTQITGRLQIIGESLTQIPAFNNLEMIGEGLILAGRNSAQGQNNASLPAIGGFQNLESIGNDLNISLFDGITAIPKFESLKTIGEDIYIAYLASVETIDGFNQLETVIGNIRFSHMDALETFIGFASLTNLTNFGVYQNPNLTFCTSPFLCNYLANNGAANVTGNSPNCGSVNAILDACNAIAPVRIFTFIDVNENKVLDVDEPALVNIIYDYFPSGSKIYSSLTNPTYLHDVPSSSVVSFGVENLLWELTTDSMSYTINVDPNDPNATADSLYFGLKAIQDIAEMTTVVNSPNTRCNTTILFDVHATNTGTTFNSGTLWLEFDEAITSFTFVDQPDLTDGTHKVGWNFDNLPPSGQLNRKINLDIPGPGTIDLGTYLQHQSYVEFSDGTTDYTSDDFDYETIVLCSYDPNDKMVYPRREGNFSFPDETLVYTIRFQNTGNAEAIDVVVLDTLEAFLNPTTLRVLSTSHPAVLTTELREGNIIHFTFRDIYLPDSLSNPEGSNGYVSFSIDPIAGLEEADEIRNDVAIYFDFNPPIYTNETLNILAYDEDEDGYFSLVDCDDMNNAIYPGAVEIIGNGIDEDCDGDDLTSVANLAGNEIQVFPNPAKNILHLISDGVQDIDVRIFSTFGQLLHQQAYLSQIDLSDFASGVYWLTLTDTNSNVSVSRRIVVQK